RGLFCPGQFKHGSRKIYANDPRVFAPSVQGEGHVAGAAAKIQHAHVRARQDRGKGLGSTTPPELIHIGGKQLIETVMRRSNRGEQLTYGARGRLLVFGSLGGGPAYRARLPVSHAIPA